MNQANKNLQQISYSMFKMGGIIRDINMHAQNGGYKTEAFE